MPYPDVVICTDCHWIYKLSSRPRIHKHCPECGSAQYTGASRTVGEKNSYTYQFSQLPWLRKQLGPEHIERERTLREYIKTKTGGRY